MHNNILALVGKANKKLLAVANFAIRVNKKRLVTALQFK
jgi:hypothetical protein